MPTPTVDQWKDIVLGLLGVGATGAAFRQLFRRRQSVDDLAHAESRAGQSYIERLEKLVRKLEDERDNAMAKAEGVWKLYVEARDEIAALKMRAAIRDEKYSRLERHVNRMTRLLLNDHPEWEGLIGHSGFGELDINQLPGGRENG